MPALAAPLKKTEPNTEATDERAPEKQGQLNSPELGKDGKPTQRAITSAKQAWTLAKNLRQRAIDGRIATAATIASKYNGDAPFNPKDLQKTGQGWRNNFSTNFLASIVDRVKPQLLDPVHKADILTHSILPPTIENGATKSRKFCEITTRTIRAWAEWKDFISRLAQEIVLYGVATPAWLDRDWRPRLWKFDEVYLPEGTGQHARKVQVAVFYHPMLVHDFLKLFEDQGLADKAGYNIKGCIHTANKSYGGQSNQKDPTPLEEQDSIREGANLAASLENETRTVRLFHVVVQDYTGEVDLWTVNAEDGTEIRQVMDLHEGGGMDDAMTLFTFQSGNGKFYGSKGLGRLLTNLHIAIERGRNLGADQMYLSGLVIVRTNKKDAVSLQAKVRHPFIFIDKDHEIVSETIQFSHEAFLALDAKLVELANSIAGAFIPPNLEQGGSPNTKIEAAQQAERELAVKEGVLGRFFDHLSDLISGIQRKIFSAENLREAIRIHQEKKAIEQKGLKLLMQKVYRLLERAIGQVPGTAPTPDVAIADEEAVQAIVELLEAGLQPEEIAMLALTPSGSNSADEGTEKNNRTLNYIAQNKVNPYIDQRKAAEMEANIVLGEDRAKQLLIPQEDPNVENEAIREQLQEIAVMMTGDPQPVVGRDSHALHRKVLAGKLEPLVQAVATGAGTPELIGSVRLMFSHYVDHLAQDAMTSDNQKAEEEGQIKEWTMIVDQAEAAMQKAAEEAAAAGVAVGPDGMPVPVNGAPPQVDENGNIIGEDPANNPNSPQNLIAAHGAKLAEDAALADIELQHRREDREDRKQNLAEAQFVHQQRKDEHAMVKDAIQLEQQATKQVHDQAHREREQGFKEAEAERQASTPKEPRA